MTQPMLKKSLKIAALYVAVIALVIYYGLPLVFMVSTSIKIPSEVFTTPPALIPTQITFNNYHNVFNAGFARYFLNSLIVAGGTTILTLLFAIFASYSFSSLRFPGRKSLLTAILLTQLLPMAVLIVPIYRTVDSMGLLNTYQGLIIAYLTFDLPVAIWLLRGFFAAIPRDLEEAAQIDGASPLGAFLRIAVPLALPGIAATGAYAFFMAWQDFMFALAFMTTNNMETVPLGVLSFVGEHSTDWGTLMAASVLLMVPVFAIFAVVQRQFVAGLTQGGVKG